MLSPFSDIKSLDDFDNKNRESLLEAMQEALLKESMIKNKNICILPCDLENREERKILIRKDKEWKVERVKVKEIEGGENVCVLR